MISLFFEVQIKEGEVDRYLNLAAALKPSLDGMGGCLFLDRFQSLRRKNVLLSYQIWQDEGSLVAWRVHHHHHKVQETGRERVFDDYRIRVSQVIYEQKPGGSIWRPERMSPYNDPKRRAPTFAVVSESRQSKSPLEASFTHEVFESVYRSGVFAHLIDASTADDGQRIGRQLLNDPTSEYFRVFEVLRDYGMFNREEAPQFYPPVASEP